MGNKKQENLASFRYVRRNIRKAELIDEYHLGWKHYKYRVELNSGSVVVVIVEDLPCFNGGLLASIRDTSGEPIVEWIDFPVFFRGGSRLLAQKLYFRY
jgi:hypothetical protein